MRKNRPDHGSCLRNTRARLIFPVTTGVLYELYMIFNRVCLRDLRDRKYSAVFTLSLSVQLEQEPFE